MAGSALRSEDGRVKLGISASRAGSSFRESVAFAQKAEAAGFDIVAAGDNGVETYAMMGALAVSTERVQLVASVASWARSPATTAHSASTVQNLSQGRFHLGLGPTPKPWVQGWHGMQFDPVIPRFKDYLQATRACLQATPDAPTDYDGEYFPTHGYANWDIDLPADVPLLLGVTQKRMTELAGEVCDGAMVNSIVPIEWLRTSGPEWFAVGRARSGRAEEDFTVGIGRFVGVDDDRQRAYDLCRTQISFYFAIPYLRTLLEPWGYEAELAAGEAALAAGDRAAQIAAVSDRMVDSLGIAGTPGEVLEKVTAYEGLVDWMTIGGGMNHDPETAYRHSMRILEVFARR